MRDSSIYVCVRLCIEEKGALVRTSIAAEQLYFRGGRADWSAGSLKSVPVSYSCEPYDTEV